MREGRGYAFVRYPEWTVRDWLSRIDKGAKEVRNRCIFGLWIACQTKQEIAEAIGVPRKTVDDPLGGLGSLADLAKTDQAAAEHATDFEPPIYNIWQRQEEITGPRTPWARKKSRP